MKIELKKLSNYQCLYTITRADQSVERITLETKTYLVHDICHFAVEKNLGYTKGFWGMLWHGYTFSQLFGKDNPHTEELRFVEKIVGPVQSLYSGHIAKEDFQKYTTQFDITMTENVLSACLTEIRTIIEDWEQLVIGQQLTLEFTLKIANEQKTTNR